MNLSVTAYAVPPPLSRGGLGSPRKVNGFARGSPTRGADERSESEGFRQNKSAPQQSCAALKIMLHVLLKETKGYTSSRNVLNLTFFEKDAAIPTHLGVPSFQ